MLRAVYPGEPGSFAEDAALVYFGRSATIDRLPGFRDVVEAVASGAVDQGVVPIENVVFGTVQQVQDLLAAADVAIVGEVIVPVRLCLAAVPGQRIEDIERVYSHIQALGQAEVFLRSRDWSLLAATNTAGAGKMIADRGRDRGRRGAVAPGGQPVWVGGAGGGHPVRAAKPDAVPGPRPSRGRVLGTDA